MAQRESKTHMIAGWYAQRITGNQYLVCKTNKHNNMYIYVSKCAHQLRNYSEINNTAVNRIA